MPKRCEEVKITIGKGEAEFLPRRRYPVVKQASVLQDISRNKAIALNKYVKKLVLDANEGFQEDFTNFLRSSPPPLTVIFPNLRGLHLQIYRKKALDSSIMPDFFLTMFVSHKGKVVLTMDFAVFVDAEQAGPFLEALEHVHGLSRVFFFTSAYQNLGDYFANVLVRSPDLEDVCFSVHEGVYGEYFDIGGILSKLSEKIRALELEMSETSGC